MIEAFEVGHLYSNEEIFKSLKVSNAGGIRLSLEMKTILRAVIMTSTQPFHGSGENPYQDRLEAGVLTYTAMGKLGEQTLGGMNNRVTEQAKFGFPIYGFILTASRRNRSVGPKRWQYLGLLEYLRHYPDIQVDADGNVRKVWLFEFRIHSEYHTVPLAGELAISKQMIASSILERAESPDDDLIVGQNEKEQVGNMKRIEQIRGQLLAMEPKRFELFVKDLLLHCGFRDVCVTKFTADGGIDVNATVSDRIWIFENTVVQVQAKRWLHSVGRKEVAELRGRLQPFAKGALVTTSHFSKAAIVEAADRGKNPIGLVDGFRLSKVVLDEKFRIRGTP